jgi:hypothetical protein
MVREKHLESWKELEKEARAEYERCITPSSDGDGYRSRPLFRGQSDEAHKLETTLERSSTTRSVLEYFHAVARAQPELSAFSVGAWPELDWNVFTNSAQSFDELSRGALPYPELLTHLRHHGFPSPLLDWTRSLAVAAFFAYRNAKPGTRIAVWMYQEWAGSARSYSSTRPQINNVGQFVKTHRRHFLQQGQYTYAVRWSESAEEWHFANHEEALGQLQGHQDLMWKFTAPADERRSVLRLLDEFNINEYSLFQSEEGLMSTLANRHFT